MNTVIPRTLLCRRLSLRFGIGNSADDKYREICSPVWLGAVLI